MRKKLAAIVVALLAFSAAYSVGVLAVCTDTESVGANAFSTSTIDITTTPTTALVAFTSMLPGDVVTDDLVITNAAGSAALRCAISSTATTWTPRV